MANWKEYKLGEIAEIKNGKARPKESGNIPVYGGNGILDYCYTSNVSGDAGDGWANVYSPLHLELGMDGAWDIGQGI